MWARRHRGRVSVRPILVALAFAAPLMLASSSADHPNGVACLVPGELCPDLVVAAETFRPYISKRTFTSASCDVQEGHTVPGARTLLRFTFTAVNIGAADLVVGSPVGNPNFEFGNCHNHYHFKEYADYRLWQPAQFAAWHALREANPGVQAHVILAAHPELAPVKGEKRGFCVIDVVRYGVGAPKYLVCDLQGISVGWADEYHATLDGQFIDVTGLPKGQYVLEGEINAEHVFEESDYDNNRGWRNVTL